MKPFFLSVLLLLGFNGILRAEDASAQAALDQALQEAGGNAAVMPAAPAAPSPSGGLKLIDSSFDLLFSAGASTEDDASLLTLQGGGHDPKKRGLTVQNGEYYITGVVDPYFRGAANIVWTIDPVSGDTNTELEEAYLITQSLPWGLQVKGGQFFTEFGRLNPTHPHTWAWEDQPVIYTRIFGGDGMRGPGARLSWLMPLPWYSELFADLHNANGPQMPNFMGQAGQTNLAGRPGLTSLPSVASFKDLVSTARWAQSFDLGQAAALLGFSGSFGPNQSGPDGQTHVYGADLLLKWRSAQAEQGWPYLNWQNEFLRQDYFAAAQAGLNPEWYQDWGFYSQLLWGFMLHWDVGLRYEMAQAANGLTLGQDPMRDFRQRISPLLTWHLSEFSRLRLQYNYDTASHLANGAAHTLWLGAEILFGFHPAHNF